LFILAYVTFVLFSPGSAETGVRWAGNSDGHLMASCVKNICSKNILILLFFSKLQSMMCQMFFWHFCLF